MKAIYPLRLAVSTGFLCLMQHVAHADTQSLGTVTGTANSGASDFFGAAPKVNVGHTPTSDIQKVQKFNKNAT